MVSGSNPAFMLIPQLAVTVKTQCQLVEWHIDCGCKDWVSRGVLYIS